MSNFAAPLRSRLALTRALAAATLSLAVGAITSQASAQSPSAPQPFPAKPVRLVIPGAAGSGPDTLSRVLAMRLSEVWKQPVVPENVVGAGGNIGHERAAKASPDGHTLLIGMIGPMAINPALNDKLGFDPARDLAAVTMIARYPNILVVHPGVPLRSLAELIAYAKANPGKLRYGAPGNGTTPHLSAVMLETMAGIRMLHVPYKSSAQMTTDLLAGHIDMMFLNPAVVLPHIKSGAMRALAITSTARQPYAAEIPTMIEAGVPGYEVTSWYGLFAPAGTPAAVIAKLNRDMLDVMAMPDIRNQFVTRGDEPVPGTPRDAGDYVRTEINKWGRLIREANIKAGE